MLTTTKSARTAARPLIKWPGGKRALVTKLLPHLPKSFGTYYEPFFGGGALFFALAPQKAVLGDVNRELISCYRFDKDAPTELARSAKRFPNSEASYYRVRGMEPRTDLGRAARLLYLTRLSFNGIHRVNLRGEFNVPYGYKTHLSPIDEDHLFQASAVLQGADLRVGDFESTTADARRNDVVYFDPPYTVAHGNNGFVKYNEKIFSWADQVRLAARARALANRGCHVLVSNADHPSIDHLYRGVRKVTIDRHSVIAAASEHRRRITESLFIFEASE